MTKLKVGMAVVVIAIATFIMLQQQRVERSMVEAAALREQLQSAKLLLEENRRLAERLKEASERLQSHLHELARLRAQGGTMLRTEQENTQLKSEVDRLAKQPAQVSLNPQAAEHYRQMGPGSQDRMKHAMLWGTALRMYSLEHEGQFPENFQDAVPFLNGDLSAADRTQTARTADQYEILYHGRYEDMTDPSPDGSIVIRGKEPWKTPEGTWARVYIYGNGLGVIQVEPNGNFENWESLRLQKAKRK